jgi:hypothetical protein
MSKLIIGSGTSPSHRSVTQQPTLAHSPATPVDTHRQPGPTPCDGAIIFGDSEKGKVEAANEASRCVRCASTWMSM